ncbi:MAG: hypothetical protein IKN74_03670 [Clostridia bacterium]|nr:hypothetical protein [Clostridia bacterium]
MRIEDVFDLCEENVGKFIKYCKAKPEDSKEDISIAYSYVDDDGKLEPRTSMPMSKTRYNKQKDRIVSMLGQIKRIHEYEEDLSENTAVLDFIDLQTKYDGTRWTNDPTFTLYLFLLGNEGGFFDAFRKGKDGIYRTDLRRAMIPIRPMESPKDPKLVKRFPTKREPADD